MTSGNLGADFTRSKALDFVTYYFETSHTQPEAFGTVAGDFDNAGGSYGIIQFNWKSGTCQPIFRDLINNHPDVVSTAFPVTADYNKFVDVVLNYTTANQIAWGTSITHYTSFNADGSPVKTTGHTVNEPWNTYLHDLLISPEGQARQMETVVSTYYANADKWTGDFGLWSRRGYALCFDIAVQFGGILTATHTDITNFIAALPKTLSPEVRELRSMRYVADRCSADHSGGTFSGSAFDRKRAIANGTGTVYGGPVTTVPYDLILEPNGLVAIPPEKTPNFVTVSFQGM